MAHLFDPLTLRSVTMANRIVVSPMCEYSCEDGLAVVAREGVQIHLFGIVDFDPAQSYGTAIVVVSDPDGLYEAFASGLRQRYGMLPVAGIPRICRPRKRYGTVRGLSVVHPGGNWLRVSKLGDVEDDRSVSRTRTLDGILDVAARLGDSHGDEARALDTLIAGLRRYPEATPVQRTRAYLYRAELEVRLGRLADARQSLLAAQALPMGDEDRDVLSKEFAHVIELLEQ